MKNTLLALLFSCLAPAVRALEFRVVSWDGEIAGLFYAEGTKTPEIVAEEGVYSRGYATAVTGPLILFRQVAEAGETRRVPVAELPAPVGFTHALLVLSPADSARTRFTGVWIDDSPTSRPAQSITFRNLSPMAVALRLGAGEHSLDPGASLTLPTDAAARRMPFKLAAQTSEGWRIVASGSQAVRPGRRTLVLLRAGREQPDGRHDPVDLVVLNDLPAPVLAAAQRP